ncbi:hypothetical protein FS837_004393 [Tulasnella sp. UAMH 9824]|nr:hypothetical protein FS837_004393 [Tulasnella sp. UAMH 9824]
MPATPQSIISDVTEVILNYVRQASQELQVAPNTEKNYQTQLQAIEEEINAMEETLTSAQTSLNARIVQRKKHRNSMIRFNQLPLEIASNILWLSIVDPWPRKDYYSFLKRQQTISQVCSLWRILVEGSPRFWSIIELPCPLAAISHLLDKSQFSGLDINNFEDSRYMGRSTQMRYLSLIAPHTHRIRSLTLFLQHPDGLVAVLEKPAPMLEELKLDADPYNVVQALDLFCGQASRLRDVTLQNIAVRWDSDVLAGLRSLRIKEKLECLPTKELVRRLLAANLGLEKMDIEAWDDPDTDNFGENAAQSIVEGKPSRVVMSNMKS